MTAPALRLLPSPFKLLEAKRAKPNKEKKKSKKVSPKPLTDKERAEKRELAWKVFVINVARLNSYDPDVTDDATIAQWKLDNLGPQKTPFEIGLALWHRVHWSYVALRGAWVTKGNTNELGLFRNRFWGFLEGDPGKRNGSADPKIRQVIDLYSEQRKYWHKKTPSYAKYKSTENERRNQLDHVKAAKKAWAASPEGQAWRSSYLADAKKKRAEAKAAKKARREALGNV